MSKLHIDGFLYICKDQLPWVTMLKKDYTCWTWLLYAISINKRNKKCNRNLSFGFETTKFWKLWMSGVKYKFPRDEGQICNFGERKNLNGLIWWSSNSLFFVVVLSMGLEFVCFDLLQMIYYRDQYIKIFI